MYTTIILQCSCVSVVALIVSYRIYVQNYVWKKCRNNKSMKGKTVIITGANSGIGKQTAKDFVRRGARVVMACRDQTSTEAVIQDINRFKYEGNMIYKNIDLSSFTSIKQFAEDIIKSEESINILVNNAGVYGPPFNLTADGFETQFQVNHLSNALLTLLLLPKLHSSSDGSYNSRVIMVSSILYRKGVINENDFQKGIGSIESYELRKGYSNSKLANILFSRKLHQNIVKQNQSIDVLMASPGIVWTKLGRHMKLKWWQLILLTPFAALFVRTAKQGAQTTIHCATIDVVRPDRMYRNCRPQKWEEITSDSNLSDRVYELTLKAIETHLK